MPSSPSRNGTLHNSSGDSVCLTHLESSQFWCLWPLRDFRLKMGHHLSCFLQTSFCVIVPSFYCMFGELLTKFLMLKQVQVKPTSSHLHWELNPGSHVCQIQALLPNYTSSPARANLLQNLLKGIKFISLPLNTWLSITVCSDHKERNGWVMKKARRPGTLCIGSGRQQCQNGKHIMFVSLLQKILPVRSSVHLWLDKEMNKQYDNRNLNLQ